MLFLRRRSRSPDPAPKRRHGPPGGRPAARPGRFRFPAAADLRRYVPAYQPYSSPHRRPGHLGGRGGIFRPDGRGSCRTLFFPEHHLWNAKDGYYGAQMLLPPSNETGEWHLQNLILVDREGNRRVLTQQDLQGLGLPTVIMVA